MQWNNRKNRDGDELCYRESTKRRSRIHTERAPDVKTHTLHAADVPKKTMILYISAIISAILGNMTLTQSMREMDPQNS